MDKFILNDAQKSAVNDIEGAILVIAGAGSGKTRVLTARICHLIDIGVDPYNVLAITFTNKAANEMKERIVASSVSGGEVWTSTFHSMCAKILRIDAERLGYTSNFTIYTDLESERVVKRLCAEVEGADVKKKGNYLWHISRAKTMGLDPEKYFEVIRGQDTDSDVITRIYMAYERELKVSNALDFDDLLLKTAILFKENPDVLKKYAHRFRYVNVDEFQDTNTLQYELVKMLASEWGNLFVVGDEDQSIYSWRGAEIKNILDFHKDFPCAKIYKLEQNYRSTTSILKAANNVIKNNSARNEKTLWSKLDDDNSVEYYEAYSDRDEAGYVSRQINYLLSTGVNYRDIAVLVRANSLTRTFEEDFNLHGIPYKIFGGFRFYERKEIKDALAYVRLALNPSDNDSLLRIINYPKRGIGNTAVAEMSRLAEESGMTFFSVLINHGMLSEATAKKLSPFTAIAMDIIEASKSMQPVEFMGYVIKRSGISDALSAGADAEDANRLENVMELVSAVQQFVNDNPTAGIADFMQSVALVSDSDDMSDDNYVRIATIHAVKGLEFDTVFIIGAEEGIFPTTRAIGGGDVEEERRLMYVAITRAKNKLYVSWARSRYRFGSTEYFPKSRFVTEMRGEKQFIKNTFGPQRFGMTKFGEVAKSSLDAVQRPKKIERGSPSEINFDEFVKDTMVEHTKFGRGIIISTDGSGEDKTAAIAFKGLGVKRFSLAVAAASLKIVKDN